jgi:hypothetical protein
MKRIYPATFRFVAQCLNHCATACRYVHLFDTIYSRLIILSTENACSRSNFTSNPNFNILRTFFQSNYTHSEQLAVLWFLALLVFHKDSEIQQNNKERDCSNVLNFDSLYLLTVITTAHYGPGWYLGQ